MFRQSRRYSRSLGEAVFTDLNYADGAVLFAQDPGRWQAELKRFDDAATTMGLYISWVKTKLQNIGQVHLLNQFPLTPLTDTPWRSSLSIWAAL